MEYCRKSPDQRLSGLFAKHFGFESFDPAGGVLPRVGRESGLDAGVPEELLARPRVLGGDLRQEEAGVAAVTDDQTITADHHLLVRAAEDRSHDRYLHHDGLEF